MGRIVGAFATSHTLGAPDGVTDKAEAVFQGMREIGARLRRSRPDVLVMITSDHLNNFSVEAPAPIAVALDDNLTPYGDMGLPKDPFPGAPAFADAFAAFAADHDMDIELRHGVRPDHGVMIPQMIVDPQRTIPTMLLYLNTVAEPAPTAQEAWRLGEVLAAFVRSRPADERVAVLAAGGLSHWVGTPEEGHVNEAWDHAFLDRFVGGEAEAMVAMTNADTRLAAGNGGLEVNAWIAVAAAAAGARGEVLYYQAIPQWATGMGGAELRVE